MRIGPVKRVDRLVGLSVLGAVGLTWFVLVAFDAFTIFVGELNDVGSGHGQRRQRRYAGGAGHAPPRKHALERYQA